VRHPERRNPQVKSGRGGHWQVGRWMWWNNPYHPDSRLERRMPCASSWSPVSS